jgi:hypothetical protein
VYVLLVIIVELDFTEIFWIGGGIVIHPAPFSGFSSGIANEFFR